MGAAEATVMVPVPPAEAERRWYDTDGWPAWVDGLERVVSVRGPWPSAGAVVTWQSVPAGRGTVTERVLSHQPRAGQELEIEDETLRGRQTLGFDPEGAGTRVTLRLEYRTARRTPISPLLELLFINRSMRLSLQATLERFGAEFPSRGPREAGH